MLKVNIVDKKVGGRLKARRTAIGMSVETLAVELGVMSEKIENWESGQARIPPSLLLNIAGALKTTAAYFFETSNSVDDFKEMKRHQRAYANSDCVRVVTEQDRLLVQKFHQIKDESLRNVVVQFVERLASNDTDLKF